MHNHRLTLDRNRQHSCSQQWDRGVRMQHSPRPGTAWGKHIHMHTHSPTSQNLSEPSPDSDWGGTGCRRQSGVLSPTTGPTYTSQEGDRLCPQAVAVAPVATVYFGRAAARGSSTPRLPLRSLETFSARTHCHSLSSPVRPAESLQEMAGLGCTWGVCGIGKRTPNLSIYGEDGKKPALPQAHLFAT